ncbi:MAG: hypothetical protein DMG27_18430 [Acidobacteria bacterium]|nr:MAG: hypothetical protein DMG27_18430 [Acidobacteriota bacterium]
MRSLLRQKGRLAPEEARAIIAQVCQALEAAHAEGVVHRDLKPQNIMLDSQGRATVMDFGIARSMELTGMTQTGALLGTPDYMSPEQAKGQEVDARSDLFTLGIIFYELLTGKTPYRADTVLGTLLKRTQERARPPHELDPDLPRYLSDVVVRCLEIDPQLRYQSASEIISDLETQRGTRPGLSVALHKPGVRRAMFSLAGLGVAVALALLLVVGLVVRSKLSDRSTTKPGQAAPAVSLAILPFRNASGDPSLDWLGPELAELLSTDVGQSPSLRTVSSDRLHQILHDLQLTPNAALDPTTIRRVAEFSSAQTVVWGRYARFGDQIRIDATVEDLKRDRTATMKAEAPNANAIPGAVDTLAQAIRENLALSASVLKELQAQAFKPSSNSLPALRDYNDGLQLLRQGHNLEAQKRFEASTKEDSGFALAYAKLAQTYANLGGDSEAERYSRKAVDLSEKLPAQEKYRIAASHARIMKDYPKAIESYENLAKVAPGDTDVQSTLARLYEETGAFDRARDLYAKVLTSDPKSVDALLAMGRVEIEKDNPSGGLDYLNRALSLAIELDNQEEKAAILQAIGVAYGVMNKPEDALRNYRQSLEIKRRIGKKRGMAESLHAIAQLEDGLGRSQVALKDYTEALQLEREIGDSKGTGDTLIDFGNSYNDHGQYDRALSLLQEALQIERDAGNESQVGLCLNSIGNTYFSKGDFVDARTYFEQALTIREKLKVPGDTADALHNLAETASNVGEYDQALKYYLRALDLRRSSGDKRRAAIESYSVGTLFENQGRYGAAVTSKEEALKTFRELGERSFWMAEILSGYGHALAEAGRGEEAQKSLDEALSLARELKNDAMVSQVLNFQGDSFFWRGHLTAARRLYDRALEAASRSKDRSKALLSKVNLAKAAVKEGRSREAVSLLRGLGQEADTQGLRYLSLECSTYLAEALVNTRDYPHARQELDRALGKAEKPGLRALLAKDQYLLGTTLRLSGNASDAPGHYREALRLLDDIRKEPGADKAVQRADLSPVYTECARWSRGATP